MLACLRSAPVPMDRIGGDSWSAANSGIEGVAIAKVVIDPRGSSTLFALAPQWVGIKAYASLDGGGNWLDISAWLDSEVSEVNDIAIDYSGNTMVLFAATDRGVYRHIPGVAVATTAIANGWQTLSVPVVVPDFAATAVWPTAISEAFAYLPDTGYVPRETLENGPGYFIRFSGAQTVALAEGLLEQVSVPVFAGWNLVGSISNEIPTSNVCLYPQGNTFTSYWMTFQGGYTIVNSLKPGLGHWIKVQQNGNLVIHEVPTSCYPFNPPAEEEMDHFIITDAQGAKQDLYVANLDRDPSLAEMDLSMPPPFPDAEFDARFESAAGGEYIKAVSPDSGTVELVITVETQAYPVTVTWNLNPENSIEYEVVTQGMGKHAGSSLSRSGSATITSSSGGRLRLSAEAASLGGSNGIPRSYALSQNYPNPFNPTTRIRYELPQDGDVQLAVYDLLGREVSRLAEGFKRAGRCDVRFDGSDLASGVYLYRLQAVDFVETKKLLVLR